MQTQNLTTSTQINTLTTALANNASNIAGNTFVPNTAALVNTKHCPILKSDATPANLVTAKFMITSVCRANKCDQFLKKHDAPHSSLPANGHAEQNPTPDQVAALQQHENCIIILGIVFEKVKSLTQYIQKTNPNQIGHIVKCTGSIFLLEHIL